ncbi:GNAT family N-acetyltransferase [Alkalimarinus sediminis]|uniref:GNAT family N-acetyltransferase n=1 Tax=Alkalimarinus sediminis TaxID=1632866 RepID=A0A9E8HNK9_9ALTE|nr:GNAT family N-acetyltransferase [Alkalimarinus sediminis]UZW76231.1 GNAT family N-acetyltransferase [Alkalimarinus sediminis]
MTETAECVETKIVRLDPAATNEAKAILYHAYRDEPTFKYLFDASRAGYDQRVRATIRELIDLHFAHNQDVIGLSADNRLVGIALVGSPTVRLNLAEQFNWRIRMMLTAGLSSTRRYIEYHMQVKAILPGDEHHELPLMGIDASHQNQGYGRLLLNAVEKLCSENPRSSGIGLDTGNARYIEFYESLGYQKVGEINLGDFTETVLFKPRHNPD